ncbi:dehydrogenase reductase SDR family member 11-like protein [Labeo rohita]|uniref:Dehydrogenase reductase SDR family member 11-like protein n=1 Tax=Labeo rohita TaxID=84645 RepID=A0A498P039_LABRO|nr:dehydrogenase reductase SDR family member 11-like protein [Labeo rohita]
MLQDSELFSCRGFETVACIMERWIGRVALVTGASVGIGAAVAKSLVQHGMKVVGCARNVEQIESISPGIVETEFVYRLFHNNPEKAAAGYASIKCLKADDIASAVVYVLSAPPHVQLLCIGQRQGVILN